MSSQEKKDSDKEKEIKEQKQDAKDDAIIKRSHRNGSIQNAAGYNKYPKWAKRIMTDEYYEQVLTRCDDAHPYTVPIGFTRYRTKLLDTTQYVVILFNGWRVSVPRYWSKEILNAFLIKLKKYGSSSVGYVISGDTLVPANLTYANRAILASQ